VSTTDTSTRIHGLGGTNFKVAIEYNKDLLFIHFDEVKKFDRQTLSEMEVLLKDWWSFVDTVGYKAIFALLPNENKKAQKLLYRLGFKHFLNAGENTVFFFTGNTYHE
jgi:hypothetical protein